MSIHEYRLIAAGWFLLLAFLTIFWFVTLRRLAQIIKERLPYSPSAKSISGFSGMFRFLIRAEYQQTRDKQLIAICKRLRQLLYGYLGAIGAYLVFLVMFRPRF
jgi:hypothetical protein